MARYYIDINCCQKMFVNGRIPVGFWRDFFISKRLKARVFCAKIPACLWRAARCHLACPTWRITTRCSRLNYDASLQRSYTPIPVIMFINNKSVVDWNIVLKSISAYIWMTWFQLLKNYISFAVGIYSYLQRKPIDKITGGCVEG